MNDLTWLEQALHAYEARYPAERTVAARFRRLLSDGTHAAERARADGHLTASAWVTDETRRHVLLVNHRKLGKWLQPGGHADGHTNLLQVARTEVREETGLEAAPLGDGEILDLDIHPIPAIGGDPSHEHFDVRFLLEAPGSHLPRNNHENHDARWVPTDRVEELTTEESILRMRRKAAVAFRDT
jgi:8-oxo-dGTP pyrophosphatase MutT (NUDIX family)